MDMFLQHFCQKDRGEGLNLPRQICQKSSERPLGIILHSRSLWNLPFKAQSIHFASMKSEEFPFIGNDIYGKN